MAELSPVVRELREEDIPAALDLICAEWREVPRDAQQAMIHHDPWRDRQRSFVAFVGDRLVAHARFHYRPVRLGQARLRMIGVCCVVTHPDYRRQGLGHRVMQAGLDWMKAGGCHFAMLYTGVQAFYAPLGWGRLDEVMYYVPLATTPRLGRGRHRVRHVPIGKAPAEIAAIFQQSCGRHPISLDRTDAYWQSWPHWAKGNVWFGMLADRWTVAWKNDRPVAYGAAQQSVVRGGASAIIEACALPHEEEALLDVFDDLAERCRRRRGQAIELNLPPDHPVVSRLAPVAERTTDPSAMVQVLDLPGLLEALKPELEPRSTGFSQPQRVRLDSPLGGATLSVAPGTITVNEAGSAPAAEATSTGLGALLLGFRSAADLHEAGELQADSTTLEILDQLFPCQHSHYWQIDHF